MSRITRDTFTPIKEDWLSQSRLDESVFIKECSFAIQHVQKNPLLEQCDTKTIIKSVLNLAQVGLTLNPVAKEAFLIPRYDKNKKILECVLDPSYIGLLRLLTDSGAVTKIESQIIWEGDYVEVNMSGERKIETHTPYFLTKNEKGKMKGVYSIAKLHDGSYHCEIMSKADVEDIRERSDSYKAYISKKVKSCIWVTDPGEMSRKTVIKRHYKYLPKSGNSEKIENAIALSNIANGFDPPIEFGTVTLIEGLIHNSILTDEEKANLESEILSLEFKSQGMKMIEYLNKNQPVMGLESYPVNQSDAMKATTNAVLRDNLKENKKNHDK